MAIYSSGRLDTGDSNGTNLTGAGVRAHELFYPSEGRPGSVPPTDAEGIIVLSLRTLRGLSVGIFHRTIDLGILI